MKERNDAILARPKRDADYDAAWFKQIPQWRKRDEAARE
jgi:hypothetical protein